MPKTHRLIPDGIAGIDVLPPAPVVHNELGTIDRKLENQQDGGIKTTHIDVPLFPTTADAPVSDMTIGEIIAAEQQSLFGEDVERLRQSV